MDGLVALHAEELRTGLTVLGVVDERGRRGAADHVEVPVGVLGDGPCVGRQGLTR